MTRGAFVLPRLGVANSPLAANPQEIVSAGLGNPSEEQKKWRCKTQVAPFVLSKALGILFMIIPSFFPEAQDGRRSFPHILLLLSFLKTGSLD